MSLSYAILGFLNYTPMSGYEIKKILDDSVNFFWIAQTSQIYRELKILETKEFITSEVQPSTKGPDKRVYTITNSGILHLKNWLYEGHTKEIMRNEFMIWILFSSNIDKKELVFNLEKKLKEYKKEYQMLKLVQNKILEYAKMFAKEEDVFYWKLVLKRGCYDVEAKIRWLEESLKDIQLE
jgi:PadR family transcriptional regulator, regulatory protein AphA